MSDLITSINSFSVIRKSRPLSILIVFSNSQNAIEISDGLCSNSNIKVVPLAVADTVLKMVELEQPEIIIIESPELGADTQVIIETIRKTISCPILMFVDAAPVETVQKAVAIGINAFCVNGLNAPRVKPLIELAFARYEQSSAMHQDLLKSQKELEGRKSIERAKGLIMERRQISERDAYDLIRRMSMAKGKSMRDIAVTILDFSDFIS